MSRSPRMISTGRGGDIWPPMNAALAALRQARVKGVKIYLFGTGSGWRTATDLGEVPADSAIWEFPAASTLPARDAAGA